MVSAASLCLAQELSEPRLQDPSRIIRVTAKRASGVVPGFGTVDKLFVYDVRGPGLPNGIPYGVQPPVIAARQGQTLDVEFFNELNGEPQPVETNLHTHGLAISPKGTGFDDAGVAPRFGECIFVGSVASTAAPSPAGAHAHGAPSAKDPCQGGGPLAVSESGGSIRYRWTIPSDHASGLFWYHAHHHGDAEAQLAAGLSGLLTIGDLWDYAYFHCWTGEGPVPPDARPCANHIEERRELTERQRADVRYLGLKDIQVQKDGANWRLARDGQGAVSYDKNLCGSLQYDPRLPSELQRFGALAPAADNGKIEWASEPGLCWSKGKPDDRWLFTVAGERFPTLTVPPGSVQIWRVANMSADASYRLRVETPDPRAPHCPGSRADLPADLQHHCLSLVLLSRDGVAVPGGRTVEEKEIALMPSARADVYVRRCSGGAADAGLRNGCLPTGERVEAKLVTAGVATGAAIHSGDQWPPIELARVVAEPSPGTASSKLAAHLIALLRSAGFNASAPPPQNARPAAPTPAAPVPAPVKVATGPSEDPSKCAFPASYPAGPESFSDKANLVRLVRFNNQSSFDIPTAGDEHFGLHIQNFRLADGNGAPIAVKDLVGPAARKNIRDVSLFDDCHAKAIREEASFPLYYPAFPHAASEPLPLFTAWTGETEYWLLVNDSDECHNFHIHQTKFEVVASDVVRLGSGDSADQCLGDRDPRRVVGRALHDNFPLPPFARVLVRIAFDETKAGRFVFHCHILEHEDKGMMSVMDVVRRQ